MVLNFIHLNGILFLPILFCIKNIGPLELSFINKEININNGRNEIKNMIENNKSKIFLIKL
tara:strand:- start:41 stop:223 length:183 start_codon:yes stop_codon:yes gene_type:complete